MNRMWIVSVVVACFYLHTTKGALSLPPYIKPCARWDPNIDQCALEHGREAIPSIVKGDPKYNIPTLDPFYMPEVRILDKGPKQASLKLVVREVNVHGIKNAFLKSINFSFPVGGFEAWAECSYSRLEMISKYDISGKILVLPIVGSGDANITLINCKTKFHLNFTLDQRDGTTYMTLRDTTIDINVDKMVSNLTNLFGGNKILGEEMNLFLNENWKDLFAELSPTIIQSVKNFAIPLTNGIVNVVPFDSIFPEAV